jgi:hypothetical protein
MSLEKACLAGQKAGGVDPAPSSNQSRQASVDGQLEQVRTV